jgi:hypothetical protein
MILFAKVQGFMEKHLPQKMQCDNPAGKITRPTRNV